MMFVYLFTFNGHLTPMDFDHGENDNARQL